MFHKVKRCSKSCDSISGEFESRVVQARSARKIKVIRPAKGLQAILAANRTNSSQEILCFCLVFVHSLEVRKLIGKGELAVCPSSQQCLEMMVAAWVDSNATIYMTRPHQPRFKPITIRDARRKGDSSGLFRTLCCAVPALTCDATCGVE